jgi:hypothetical protein
VERARNVATRHPAYASKAHWAKPEPVADKSQETSWDFMLGLGALDAWQKALPVPLATAQGKTVFFP